MVEFGKSGEPAGAAAPQAPPPGWYDDPERAGGRRWWDGTAWTEHRSSDGAASSPGWNPQGSATRGPLSAADARSWAVAAHLTAYVAAFAALAFLGPLVVFLLKKDDDPWVRAHAAAALNFQLSWLLWGVALTALLTVFMVAMLDITLAALALPVLAIGGLAWLVLVALRARDAAQGRPARRYPLTIEFVK